VDPSWVGGVGRRAVGPGLRDRCCGDDRACSTPEAPGDPDTRCCWYSPVPGDASTICCGALGQGDVLQHCNYDDVNVWSALAGNNALTSRDAPESDADFSAPAGDATHRFRVRYPTWPALGSPPTRAPTVERRHQSSMCRATTGTGTNPKGDGVWNGRGQRCELPILSVHIAVDERGLPTGTSGRPPTVVGDDTDGCGWLQVWMGVDGGILQPP
jgi:hypothetical protein